MISIIIPAYNAEKSIRESLSSIENQSYDDYEVLVIDDGSEDRTGEIVKEYAQNNRRIKYYYQENKGVALARNKGLEESKGQYICFLDADDFYEPIYLEKMVEKITSRKSNVCYCGYNTVYGDKKIEKKTRFKEGDILSDYIMGVISIHTTGWIIKRSLLSNNKIVFPAEVSWGEDFEFFCQVLASASKVSYVDEYLTNYKVNHDENQLSSFTLDKIDKDYQSIMRMVGNSNVNKDKLIEEALLDYRLQALIIYRLISAIDKRLDLKEIKEYYNKYEEYIKKWTFNNGLRSVKLNWNRWKLIRYHNKS